MKLSPVRIADDKYPTSVIFMPKEHKKGAFYHPTQKPVALMEYLIRTYTDEGDVVLDNCIGSGTTAVAAIRTGRHYIGFEIEQVYCEIAERRIQEELECRNKAQEEKEIKGRKTKSNKSMTWTKKGIVNGISSGGRTAGNAECTGTTNLRGDGTTYGK